MRQSQRARSRLPKESQESSARGVSSVGAASGGLPRLTGLADAGKNPLEERVLEHPLRIDPAPERVESLVLGIRRAQLVRGGGDLLAPMRPASERQHLRLECGEIAREVPRGRHVRAEMGAVAPVVGAHPCIVAGDEAELDDEIDAQAVALDQRARAPQRLRSELSRKRVLDLLVRGWHREGERLVAGGYRAPGPEVSGAHQAVGLRDQRRPDPPRPEQQREHAAVHDCLVDPTGGAAGAGARFGAAIPEHPHRISVREPPQLDELLSPGGGRDPGRRLLRAHRLPASEALRARSRMPASTVTSRWSSCTSRTRSSRSSDRSMPSVQAMSLQECPAPTTLTRAPLAAARTSSATASSEAGWARAAGIDEQVRAQLTKRRARARTPAGPLQPRKSPTPFRAKIKTF